MAVCYGTLAASALSRCSSQPTGDGSVLFVFSMRKENFGNVSFLLWLNGQNIERLCHKWAGAVHVWCVSLMWKTGAVFLLEHAFISEVF